MKNDFIYKNVANDVTLPPITKGKKRSLTDTEKWYVLNSNIKLKNRVFLCTLLYAGLQRGEALALERGDIDLENKCLNVNKNLVLIDNDPQIKECPKTSAGFRTIPLPDILLNGLKEYLPTLVIHPARN